VWPRSRCASGICSTKIDAGEREGLTSGERARLAELERENQRLRMERDLLKRAAAFFAKETEAR
jgi:transposase